MNDKINLRMLVVFLYCVLPIRIDTRALLIQVTYILNYIQRYFCYQLKNAGIMQLKSFK